MFVLMKEPKTGSKFYENKGLKRVTGFIKPSSVRRYKAAALKRGWSLVQYVSYRLEKDKP
mgnify:CR=1 FL=1